MFIVYIHSGNSIILTALFLLQALNYERYGGILSLSLPFFIRNFKSILFDSDGEGGERACKRIAHAE